MDVRFADAEVCAPCNRLARLQARWGNDGGLAVARRLQHMRVAPHLAAMMTLPGDCRPHNAGLWIVEASNVAVIRFSPDGATATTDMLGVITSITVIEVADRKGGS
jgi:hypothetical protein